MLLLRTPDLSLGKVVLRGKWHQKKDCSEVHSGFHLAAIFSSIFSSMHVPSGFPEMESNRLKTCGIEVF